MGTWAQGMSYRPIALPRGREAWLGFGALVAVVIALVLPHVAPRALAWPTIWLELVLVALTMWLGAALFKLNPLRRPFAPLTFFLLLFGLYFLAEPIDSILLGHHILDFYGVKADDAVVIGQATGVAVLSLVAVYAGYWLIAAFAPLLGSPQGTAPDSIHRSGDNITAEAPLSRSESPWSDRSIYLTVGALFLVNILAVALFVYSLGGVGRYFSGLSLGLLMVQGPVSHYFPFVAVYSSVGVLAFVIHRFGRLPIGATLALTALTLLLLQFDPNLTRQNVLSLALGLLIAYLCLRPRADELNSRDWKVTGGLIVVLLAYSVGHELYRELSGVNYVTPSSFAGYVHALFEPFRPSQDYIALTTMLPGQFSFDYGRHFLDIFTFAIPRDLWAAKPPFFGYQWVSYGPLQTTNYETSFTYLGELYAAGGAVGVAIGSGLLGAGIGGLERLRGWAAQHRYVLLVYVILMAVWLPNLVRAGFFDSTVNLVSYLPPVVLLGLVVRNTVERRQIGRLYLALAVIYVACSALVLIAGLA